MQLFVVKRHRVESKVEQHVLVLIIPESEKLNPIMATSSQICSSPFREPGSKLSSFVPMSFQNVPGNNFIIPQHLTSTAFLNIDACGKIYLLFLFTDACHLFDLMSYRL